MTNISNCMNGAPCGGQDPLVRATSFLGVPPSDLAQRSRVWFRGGVLGLLAVLVASTATLAVHSLQLEAQLKSDQLRVSGLADWLAQTQSGFERLEALEAHIGAGRRVIATTAESIVFLQGTYGFVEPKSGKPLRFLGFGPDGQPVRDATGSPYITLEGEGPIVEKFFSGTAFVASHKGLLMTNRHVAIPWEFDDAAKALIEQGLTPVVHRFIGYLAGVKEPFDVELVIASDEADVAVLRGHGLAGWVRPLTLSDVPARLGDDVIVLGYPTGIRALLARSDESFVDEITSRGDADFWTVARQLSATGRIAPLATRGIVGQVSAAAVVYDAATTSGGSGGPVVDLNGKVVAVNTAILPEFGGSNLGVPAEQVRKLLMAAERKGISDD